MAKKNINNLATFDCRVFNVPNKQEACNVLMWREMDATRNSISAAAQANFSHKELQGKSKSEMMEMLFQKKNINWNDYPSYFKRGVYWQKKSISRPYSSEEIEKLPLKHEARKNPKLTVLRSKIIQLDMPIFSRVANREEVVFEGKEPILMAENK